MNTRHLDEALLYAEILATYTCGKTPWFKSDKRFKPIIFAEPNESEKTAEQRAKRRQTRKKVSQRKQKRGY